MNSQTIFLKIITEKAEVSKSDNYQTIKQFFITEKSKKSYTNICRKYSQKKQLSNNVQKLSNTFQKNNHRKGRKITQKTFSENHYRKGSYQTIFRLSQKKQTLPINFQKIITGKQFSQKKDEISINLHKIIKVIKQYSGEKITEKQLSKHLPKIITIKTEISNNIQKTITEKELSKHLPKIITIKTEISNNIQKTIAVKELSKHLPKMWNSVYHLCVWSQPNTDLGLLVGCFCL